MMPVSFYIMAAVGIVMMANGLVWKRRLWEAPTWVGFIFVSFIIPQALYIEKSGTGEQIASWFSWYYITGCLIAFWWSFNAAKRRQLRIIAPPHDHLIDSRLTWRAALLLILGALSLIKIRQFTTLEEHSSQWTGVVTLYYLIFQLIFVSLSVSLVRWLSTKKKIWKIFAIVALTLAIISILANAKRSLTAEVVFVIGATLFFLRGWAPKRTITLVTMLLGTVLVNQIGPVRDYIRAGNGSALDAALAGVPFEEFVYFNMDKAPELTQGVADIYDANRTGQIYGPALLWNKMVHQYVPAFLVGSRFKESLKIEFSSNLGDGLHEFSWFGATRTGFSDSYKSYNIFGVFVFSVVGGIMGVLYARAISGEQWALFLYPLLINDSMFTITESTSRFFSGGFFLMIVTVFLFWKLNPIVNQRQYGADCALPQQADR